MNQFFLAVDIPDSTGATFPPSSVGDKWRTFESKLKSIGLPTKGCARASRNVWRIDAENALPALLALTGLAQECGLEYSAFLISGEITELAKPARTTKG